MRFHMSYAEEKKLNDKNSEKGEEEEDRTETKQQQQKNNSDNSMCTSCVCERAPSKFYLC